jgi:hypothetical protein
MNALRLKTMARQVGVGAFLVAVVVLSSILFSILGALCTAVGTGLMMGASRRWKWQVIPVSLVFGLAGLTIAQAAGAEFDPGRRFIAAAVCCGAFWGTYLMTRLILMLEQDGVTAGKLGDVRPVPVEAERGIVQERTLPGLEHFASTPVVETPGQAIELSLRDLLGTWLCETTDPDDRSAKRRLEITEAAFALTVTDSGGHTQRVAQVEFELENTNGARRVLIAHPRCAFTDQKIEPSWEV